MFAFGAVSGLNRPPWRFVVARFWPMRARVGKRLAGLPAPVVRGSADPFGFRRSSVYPRMGDGRIDFRVFNNLDPGLRRGDECVSACPVTWLAGASAPG